MGPWMTIARAELQNGVVEWPDPGENPEIMKYFSATTHGPSRGDETPWCAAFVNWCLYKAGANRTKSAAAMSFANSDRMEGCEPQVGAICVLRDRNSLHSSGRSGHVGFVEEVTSDVVTLLGGNHSQPHQRDGVTLKNFSRDVSSGRHDAIYFVRPRIIA